MRFARSLPLLFCLCATIESEAGVPADGFVDPSFGSNGLARIDPNLAGFGTGNTMRGAAVDSNTGKFYILGGGGGLLLARMNANGSLDAGFNGDGYVNTLPNVANVSITPIRVAVSTNGKPLLVGVAVEQIGNVQDNNIVVCRLFAAGNPDTGFDGDGCRIIEIDAAGSDGLEMATAVLPLSDQSLLIGGHIETPSGYRAFVAKLLASGAYDVNFGLGGLRYIDLGNVPGAFAQQIAVAESGAIFVAGNIEGSGQSSSFIAKFDSSGSQIGTFGQGGYAYANYSSAYAPGDLLRHHITGLVVDDLERPTLCGNLENFTANEQMITLTRFGNGGAPDPGFNGNGRVFMTYSDLNALNHTGGCVLDRERRLSLALDTSPTPFIDPSLAMMRFREDGLTDEEFNGSGYLSLAMNIGQGGGGMELATSLISFRGDLIVFATAKGDTQEFGGPNEFAALRIRNDRTFRDGFELND